jgi:hypothetical protein
MHRDRGAIVYRQRLVNLQSDARFLRQRIKRRLDVRHSSARLNINAACLARGGIPCRPEALQRIAQLATRGSDVMRFVADAHRIVQAVLDGSQGQAWTVVGDGQALIVQVHGNDWRHPARLTGVKPVVEQLFRERNEPVLAAKTDLHGQFAFGEKLQHPTGLKDRTPQCVWHQPCTS